jgi:transcriptional regulator with XRE-family HTH domain
MTEEAASSSVPRRQLGRRLRELRIAAGLSLGDVACAVELSVPTLSRIERGKSPVRAIDTKGMCELYQLPPEPTGALMALARQTKAAGWWLSYRDVIPQGFDVYLGLEDAASELCWYEAELVPGLLQTTTYHRLIARAVYPGETEADIEQRVELRLNRRRILTRSIRPPTLDVILNEAVIRRTIGGHAVMAEQLSLLIELARLPNVSIRVIPFEAGLHLGVASGPFTILHFSTDGRDSEPPIVHMENVTGALYLDKHHEITVYESTFVDIGNLALDEPASMSLIHRTAEEYSRVRT